MTGEHKTYGYEGGYEDWTADKVYKKHENHAGWQKGH